MAMKKKKSKITEEEKVAVQFMKRAIKSQKQTGIKIVGMRKA